ncbi:hypothetical protein D6D28_00021 [Aureobasidium pullulans]|uniref:DUF8004 domain-containing protein n=1 Tax=Aureobasidium pullulans TaxID=5580 RepID=A0A4S8T2A2_AURPU|nr:hypothetical protein D6D28_00021 [Aureobasidium pullulans]
MGDCQVYLFPRTSGKGPSFRIQSALLDSSKLLSEMVLPLETAPLYEQTLIVALSVVANLRLDDPSTPPTTPKSGSTNYLLFMPIALKSDSVLLPTSNSQGLSEDEETLVAIRNLFAFLTGQSLVATRSNPTVFSVFMRLAETIREFGFSNFDGSTFGDIVTSSFDSYVDELGLADLGSSREKTIEGIVLGERMKSIKLYNEAFTHAVGKYDELLRLQDPKFRLISPISSNRLGRAAMDLDKRTASVRQTLENFDFPALFSGTLNSKTADERKEVDFNGLRDSFFATRKFVMSFYKTRYGSWPPKASKRNELETNGLNRIVCQDLYRDLCAMYDLLADRSSLTNRTADGILIDDRDTAAPHVRALRAVLSEYDRSSPPGTYWKYSLPVQREDLQVSLSVDDVILLNIIVHFDASINAHRCGLRVNVTNVSTWGGDSARQQTRGTGWGDAKKEAKAMSKKLKDDDIAEIMTASHNTDVPPSPFLNSFREVERKTARHCTIKQLTEIRMGQWLFMYAVLQALPMVCVDGPQLHHTKSVEYFLCESPKFGVPWAREDALRNISSTGAAKTGGIAHLPADVFHHGVEGIYFRSHCWEVAEKWSTENPALASALRSQHQLEVVLDSPSVVRAQLPANRSASPAIKVQSRKTVGLGLELPPPGPATGGKPHTTRPVSVYDPNLTFDSILGSAMDGVDKQKS